MSERSQIYVAYAQNPFIFATLAVRTPADPMNMSMTVRRRFGRWIKITGLESQDTPVVIDNSIGPRRF